MDFKPGSYIIRLTRGRKYLGRQNTELIPIKGTGDTERASVEFSYVWARGHCGLRGSVPGWGRSPGGGNGSSLQHSCLETPMDRGAWWATVHGVPVWHNWGTEHAHRDVIRRVDLEGNIVAEIEGEETLSKKKCHENLKYWQQVSNSRTKQGCLDLAVDSSSLVMFGRGALVQIWSKSRSTQPPLGVWRGRSRGEACVHPASFHRERE